MSNKNKAVTDITDNTDTRVIFSDPYSYYPILNSSVRSVTSVSNRKTKGKIANRSNRSNPYTEDYLQKTVFTFLSRMLPPSAIAWATMNDSGGRERAHEGARRKAMGRVAGVPDLFVLHCGRLHGIELKRPRKRLRSGKESRSAAKPSDAQDNTMRRLSEAGAPCRVCRSVDEVAAFLTECGVPLERRNPFSVKEGARP